MIATEATKQDHQGQFKWWIFHVLFNTILTWRILDSTHRIDEVIGIHFQFCISCARRSLLLRLFLSISLSSNSYIIIAIIAIIPMHDVSGTSCHFSLIRIVCWMKFSIEWQLSWSMLMTFPSYAVWSSKYFANISAKSMNLLLELKCASELRPRCCGLLTHWTT